MWELFYLPSFPSRNGLNYQTNIIGQTAAPSHVRSPHSFAPLGANDPHGHHTIRSFRSAKPIERTAPIPRHKTLTGHEARKGPPAIRACLSMIDRDRPQTN
jgi:hypothetical protein